MAKSNTYFSVETKTTVATRANGCCEYCRIRQEFIEYSFHIDHIVSLKHGGKSDLGNLAYTCPDCNYNKGANLGTYLNPSERIFVPLFHPRLDIWNEHFEELDGFILSKTPEGEATIRVLMINLPERIILRRELSQ
jgi:HNH endonuclease